ncbi:MAG: tetratricopeptide repeat protein [Alistipes sp.]|nr:tetratricopeptide repeat protein [Alistipes sp.]
MRPISAVLCATLLWGCVDAVYYENKALEQEEKGDYKKAAKYWKKVVDKAPDNYNALMNLAYANFQAGDTLRTIGALTGAVSVKPERTDALFFRAYIYAARGELLPALDDYKGLVRIYSSPWRITTSEWRDGFFLAPHRTPVREIDKGAGDAFIELGMVYYRLDSIPQAIANLELCIDKGFRPAEGHYWLAMAYKKRGDNKFELAHLRKAAALGHTAAIRDLSKVEDR